MAITRSEAMKFAEKRVYVEADNGEFEIGILKVGPLSVDVYPRSVENLSVPFDKVVRLELASDEK